MIKLAMELYVAIACLEAVLLLCGDFSLSERSFFGLSYLCVRSVTLEAAFIATKLTLCYFSLFSGQFVVRYY